MAPLSPTPLQLSLTPFFSVFPPKAVIDLILLQSCLLLLVFARVEEPEIIGQKLPLLLSITWLCLLLFWEEVIWEAVHASLCVCVWPSGLLFGDFYHLQFAKTPGWCKSVLTLLTNQIIFKLTGQCSTSLDTTYIEDIFIPEYCDSFLL